MKIFWKTELTKWSDPNGLSYPVFFFNVDSISDIFVFQALVSFLSEYLDSGYFRHVWKKYNQHFFLHLNFSLCLHWAVWASAHLSRVTYRFGGLYNTRAQGWEWANSLLVIGTQKSLLLGIIGQRSGKTPFSLPGPKLAGYFHKAMSERFSILRNRH